MPTVECPGCHSEVEPVLEDMSFDQEFGTHVEWDCYCPLCGHVLPLPDVGDDGELWFDPRD